MSVRVAIEAALREVIAPLLSGDDGGVELLSVDEAKGEVVLRFTGAFAACPGTPVVRIDVVEPVLRARAGRPLTFRYER